MKLLNRPVVGAGQHRSGWPVVMHYLAKRASGQGVLFDDFTDASFTYKPLAAPHTTPWVGVFHHPVQVDSPLSGDVKFGLRRIEQHKFFAESKRHLVGAVALCEDVGRDLQAWLGVPVLVIPHPTETGVPRWNADQAMAGRELVQVGYCLRNTQAIHHFDAPGWKRVKLFGASPHYRKRDQEIERKRMRPIVKGATTRERLSSTEYDALLASCVVFNEFFGAAANNGVVECIVRGTPLVTNRLPALVEYLGRDYPLFYGSLSDVPKLLEESRLRDASAQLLERAKLLPSFEEFAARVAEFVDSCGGKHVAA